MRMFNADGSEGEMCGNGVRCVAKYLYDHGLARKDRVTVETGRGLLALDLEAEGGKVRRVRVDMGAPILKDVEIPTLLCRRASHRRADPDRRPDAGRDRGLDGKSARRHLRG